MALFTYKPPRPRQKAYTNSGYGGQFQGAPQREASMARGGAYRTAWDSNNASVPTGPAAPGAAPDPWYGGNAPPSTVPSAPASNYGQPSLPVGAVPGTGQAPGSSLPPPYTSPVMPSTPTPPSYTPPGSDGYYQNPPSYSTGYPGTVNNQQPGFGGYAPPQYGLPQGSQAAGASQYAYGQMNQAAQAALAALQRDYMGSAFGQQLQQQFTNGTGLSPEAMAARNRQAQEANAFAATNAMASARQRAGATGGLDDSGQIMLESQIRGGAARDMQRLYDQILLEDASMRGQSKNSAASLLAQMMGLEANQAQAYAQFQGQRQFPVIPGVTPGGSMPGAMAGAGQGYRFINSRGEILSLKPDGSNLTPYEMQQAMQERIRWLASQGQGTGNVQPY